MSKFPFFLLAAWLLCANRVHAADPATSEKPKPVVIAAAKPAAAASAKAKTPEPEPTPEAKKRGLMGRVFGKKNPPPEATPAPAATPAATPAPRIVRKIRSADETTDTPKSKKAESEKPQAAVEKPAPEKPAEAPAARGKKGAKVQVAAVKKPVNQPPDTTDPEVLERWKLNEAKTKALEDPELRAIKTKADAAPSDEESRKTLRIYNKALFSKIREIDPSIKERASQMESAILKQLSEPE